jgi:hypothetical protein
MLGLGLLLVAVGGIVLIPGGETPGAAAHRFVRGAPGHLFDTGPRRAPQARWRVLQVVVGLLLITAGIYAIAQVKV